MQNDQALQVSPGFSWQLRFCYLGGGMYRVTCATPRRNIPIALRPARNSATSTFPSLLVSSLSNKSWYDLSLSASQHRAPGSKNVRSARYMLAAESGQRSQESCEPTDPFKIRIQLHFWWKPVFLVAFFFPGTPTPRCSVVFGSEPQERRVERRRLRNRVDFSVKSGNMSEYRSC